MSQALRLFRLLADPTRLRILALLEHQSLSVAELQDILGMGQSRISTHLGQLQEAEILESERKGKRIFYGWNEAAQGSDVRWRELALEGAQEVPEYEEDQLNLRRILGLREQRARLQFNQIAGRFDRSYGPGRSWQAFGQLLLELLPPLDVADLGSGEGLLSELLARRCRSVIAVDNSEKMVQFGQKQAEKNGLRNLQFRLGDLENPPIPDHSVDVALLSQALHHAENPALAVTGAARILRPGGRLLILDLLKHEYAETRQLYGDRWQGFTEGELYQWMEEAGLQEIETFIVSKEEEPPYFQTLLAKGRLPER